ncbi:Alcohol oxidase [Purpureocillium lavendulum]|uniref:Alcohol oxidase n=1 Tax=Purpureocillium lavendulum TaxID=1247861 RepID=A0AB34FCV8_9HYPO|nr:Alcohol oxidase [Purpureocillium lavendulum]
MPLILPSASAKTMEKPLEFIITNPDIVESFQPPDGASSASTQTRKQWEPVVRNLLTKKLPQCEEDWDRILHTQDDVNKTLQRIVLSHLSPEEKAALSWKDLFGECAKHFEILAGDKTDENPIELFRLAVIGLSDVAAAISVILTDVIISRPLQRAKGLYSYGFPPASQEYFNAAIMEQATEIERWASKHDRTFANVSNVRAESFRSDEGTATWPTLGGALLLPLTNEAIDIKLLDRNTGTARRKIWHPNHIMYLEHEGFAAINGSIHYIYALVNSPN